MKLLETALKEVKLIEPLCFGDQRGWFMESYHEQKFTALGIRAVFVQDNHSFSAGKGTLRGLHFQNEPMAQAKLLRCTRGSILDVAVDIRRGSPTYTHWMAVTLSAENKRMLFVPRGFAHGFLTLEDNCELQYKVDRFFDPHYDRAIYFNDPALGIDWGLEQPILSEKDERAPLLADCDANFVY